jgi:RHS repeat-associated protein
VPLGAERNTWADATSGAGIYYNVARWLETGTGRFTRPDPIRWRGSRANTHSYGENQPLLFVDRFGLAAVQNNSGMPIPYKPAHEETIKLCPPGQNCDADGVYPPSCSEFPIKIVDGCTGQVGTNGKLVIWCPFFNPGAPELKEKFPALGQLVTGGRTNEQFHEDHPDWPIPNGKPFRGCEVSPPPQVPQPGDGR